MNMPGRNFSSDEYRYGFNGQERSTEINENSFTAEYWQYDSKLGRRWNIDPVVKTPLSGYSTFANNPIWFKDPNGADSIFYNQNGTENRRFKMKGDHTYWLQHKDGNKSIGGNTYFQGNSYYSFFGDGDKFKKPTLFTSVEKNKFPDLSKETLDKLVEIQYDDESYWTIWFNSGAGAQFDYKNIEYFNSNKQTGMDAANITTAYLIDGILHNRNETGMYLWGATMGKTSIGYTGLYLDNKLTHNIIEGNNDELQELNTWRKGFLTMKKAADVNKYTNTYMYGAFGMHFDKKVQGVDPTNKDGIYYDEWEILGHKKVEKTIPDRDWWNW